MKGKAITTTADNVFYLFSRGSIALFWGEFGHGEWSFESSVLTIKPEIYFRIGNSPEVFFVGLNERGWEDSGIMRSTNLKLVARFSTAIEARAANS